MRTCHTFKVQFFLPKLFPRKLQLLPQIVQADDDRFTFAELEHRIFGEGATGNLLYILKIEEETKKQFFLMFSSTSSSEIVTLEASYYKNHKCSDR